MEKRIKISRRDSKKLAELINGVIVWGDMVKEKIKKENRTEEEEKNLNNIMTWHDEEGKKINEMLGLKAIFLYKRG